VATLTTNEQLVDLYIERAIDLLRLEAGTRGKVVALLDDLEHELVVALADVDPSESRRRLARLLEVVRATIRTSYREVSALMAAEIREIIDVEAAWVGRSFNTAIGIEFVDAGLTRGALQTLVSDVLIQGAPSKEWWGRQATGLADRFADQMRMGVTAGEPLSKLVDRVRGKSGGQPGIMAVSKNSAERLVRASVQTAANVGREAMYAENDDIIASLEWSATLDTRTSIWCITRDGKHYHPTTHKPVGHTIPWLEGPGKLHWGCRSTSIPRLKTWRELGIDEDEIPETTRASMDGQLSSDMTFEAWLKKQSIERQNTVLGEGKAALWRAGKIGFRDLLDQGGRPLTTEELRRKAARNG
jgi:SPP1 gp7 family putative phage head morphogenesis protein